MIRSPRRLWLASVLVAIAFLSPAAAAQETASTNSDVLIRIEGPVVVPAGDSVGTLWVIGNDAIVLGTVDELIVINGAARITGLIRGNVVLISSSADIAPAARIGKDVLLYRSTVTGATGRVEGKVHNELGVSFGARALWLLWLSVTIALIVGGLVFGYLAGESLADAADTVRGEWRGMLLTTVLLVCALPLAAVLSFMTGIGLVLGFFILAVLIPVLSLLGYLVAGAAVGRKLLQAPEDHRRRLYVSIAFGILVLQLAAFVPGIGGVIAIISSQLGAGALVYRAWKRGRMHAPVSHLIIQPA